MSHHRARTRRPRQQHGDHGRATDSPLYISPSSTSLGRSNRRRAPLTFFLFLLTCLSLLGAAAARETHGDRHRSPPLPALANSDAAWNGPSLGVLVIDTSPPPAVPHLMPPLHRRREDASKTASAPPSTRSVTTDPGATESDFEVPKPFDTALSNNFTDGCANFFRRLLTEPALRECRPFSLMLQTSSGFFDASKSFIRITQTLEATCDANLTACVATTNDYARQLIEEGNCRVDYDNNNPQVLQAYNGLLAYEPLYQASCLRDDQGSYCFANAVTNTTATTDSYPYYLPLGVVMPGGARPTCNSCLQDAMAIFSSFASNSTQPVSQTYNSAAELVGGACGPTFLSKTAIPLKGAAAATTVSFAPTISLVIMLLLYFFQ
ncbi:hypothetical protein BDV95DRAFT_503453 [Massariosphaeria phaeospora]|uniref:DUF7729 domain-containing protein n=1 Tax=Massariosphaeria phaeospora TaxID=100035 RepID=A0A7C8I0D7_9PLEO|nr:hypothetical protein BDV95DRAFT_503453 [Massariosphaeria phaeospora]